MTKTKLISLSRYEEIEEVIEKIKQAIHIRDISRVYECEIY